MNENSKQINQDGSNNVNIGINKGTVNVNKHRTCDLTYDEIVHNLSMASGDLDEHKNYFGNKPDIFIERNEVLEIENWIIKELEPKEHPILVVAGQAGYGKSVVAKQLFNFLQKKNIPALALKTDKLIINNLNELERELGFDFHVEELIYKTTESSERIVIIIDQIDALSLSLSSNRSPLNTYNRLIKKLITLSPKVRIVISCRLFDLEYDPSLQQYNNLQKIVVQKLEIEKVNQVLNHLRINPAKLSVSFLNFLRVPLHLEIFSVVNDKSNIVEFTTLQELYAEYWRQKILQCPINDNNIIKLIRELSSTMFNTQQITIDKRLFENKFFKEINYLISEGVIVSQRNKIQFVHQSFFDYANARCFVEDERSISKETLKKGNHQGLFIRSGIRHVLLYLREVKHNEYIEELENLIFSNDLRFHIKLLLINTLGYIEKPSDEEKLIIQKIEAKEEFLFKLFIESVNSEEWLNLLFNKIQIHKYLPTNYDEYYGYIYQALRKALTQFPTSAIKYIKALPDFKEKKKYISRLLFFVSDYSNIGFLELFDKYSSDQDEHGYFHFLEKALVLHPDWVIKRLKDYFIKTEVDEFGKPFSKRYEENRIYEELLKAHPEKAINYFIEILLVIVNKDREALLKAGFSEYYSGGEFRFYVPNKGGTRSDELLFFICDSITNYFLNNFEKEKVRNYMKVFVETKSYHLHNLTLPVYLNYPEELSDEIYDYLIQRPILFTEFNHCQLFEYYFRELLRKAYPYFSEEQKASINKLILNAIPKEEMTKSFYYRKGVTEKGMVWHGLNKFKLLSMLPQKQGKYADKIVVEYKELKRKFDEVPNKMPNGIVVTSGETVMESNAYKYMSVKDWKATLTKYEKNDSCPWERRVSGLGHCRKFESLCKENPGKYYHIIKEVVLDKGVPISPVVYGLNGLTGSDYSVEKVAELFVQFLNIRSRELSEFPLQMTVWMTSYFIKNKIIINRIVDFLCDIIRNQPDEGPRNEDLHMDGINSIRGAAVDRLIDCYKFKEYEELIFSTLEDIVTTTNVVTRATAIAKLALLSNLNQERNLELYLKLIEDFDTRLLSMPLHNLHPLVYLIHTNFEKLIPFFEKAIEIKESHKVISHILLFAWLNDYEQSESLFYRILSESDTAKQTAIKIAFQNINTEKSFDKCYALILKFIDETNTDIAVEYEHAFIWLEPELFPKIEKYLFNYVKSKTGTRREYNFYRFLQKCILHYQNKEIAEKCIELALDFNNHVKPDIAERALTKEPLQVVIDSYSVIREYSSQIKSLELAMDAFDSMLKIPEYRGNLQEMLNKLDESIL